MKDWTAAALEAGFSHAAPLDVATLELRSEVRDMCAADKCRMYGRSWTCPPACGSLAENAQVIAGCTGGLLVQTTREIEDDFDYEGMEEAGIQQQRLFRAFHKALKKEIFGVVPLGSGGCRLCETCTYPDAPCRHPEEAVASMEAYGLWVSDVCTRNKLDYYYGPKTITYTGCYLFPVENRRNDGMAEILKEISEMLQKGKAKVVAELTEQALADGIAPQAILDEGLLAGMDVIGTKFKANEIFVPEVLVAARAMNKGVEVLKPALAAEGVQAKGTAVIGTVKGDLHDIGKNLVKMMMEGKGLNVVDLGVDVSPERFLDAAKENNASIICCSALLTTTMGEMQSVVELVKGSDLSGKVTIMVGGAPVTQSFCDQIGADCYTADAASAAEMAVQFIA